MTGSTPGWVDGRDDTVLVACDRDDVGAKEDRDLDPRDDKARRDD